MQKILYVEDDPDTLAVVKIIMQKEGYDFQGAVNANKALDLLKTSKPDLILLDIMLPDMSGWDLFQRIRKGDSKVKIAFLSAIPVSDERKKTLKKSGVMDYIMKPFDKSDLIARVKKIVK